MPNRSDTYRIAQAVAGCQGEKEKRRENPAFWSRKVRLEDGRVADLVLGDNLPTILVVRLRVVVLVGNKFVNGALVCDLGVNAVVYFRVLADVVLVSVRQVKTPNLSRYVQYNIIA